MFHHCHFYYLFGWLLLYVKVTLGCFHSWINRGILMMLKGLNLELLFLSKFTSACVTSYGFLLKHCFSVRCCRALLEISNSLPHVSWFLLVNTQLFISWLNLSVSSFPLLTKLTLLFVLFRIVHLCIWNPRVLNVCIRTHNYWWNLFLGLLRTLNLIVTTHLGLWNLLSVNWHSIHELLLIIFWILHYFPLRVELTSGHALINNRWCSLIWLSLLFRFQRTTSGSLPFLRFTGSLIRAIGYESIVLNFSTRSSHCSSLNCHCFLLLIVICRLLIKVYFVFIYDQLWKL